MCVEVWLGELQRRQELLTRYLHLHKFNGVRRQSVPARSRNDNWPAGTPVINRFQDRETGSKATMSLNFDCTCSCMVKTCIPIVNVFLMERL